MSRRAWERHLVTKPAFWRTSRICGVLALIFVGHPLSKGADPLDQWHTRYYNTNTSFAGAIYANGRFVLAGSGQDGGIFSSSDGANWNAVSTNAPNQLTGAAYGNGVYVAVGIDREDITVGSFAGYTTSTNGSDWSPWARFIPAPFPSDKWISGFATVCYGQGRFVAAGFPAQQNNRAALFFTSVSGNDWSLQPFRFTNGTVASITYGMGLFVAVGYDERTYKGRIASSLDAASWAEHDTGTSERLQAVAFGNGSFVAVGSDYILTSRDGTNWTQQQFQAQLDQFSAIGYGNGTFVVAGAAGGTFISSIDGFNWARHTAASKYCFTVCYGAGAFLAAGSGNIDQSAPLPQSELRLIFPTATLGGFLKLAVVAPIGRNVEVQTSADLINWAKLADVSCTNTTTPFFDYGATNAAQRFYRVKGQ